LSLLDERPCAATLASLSAASFPLTSLQPKIHLTVNLQGSPFSAFTIEWIRCCPEECLLPLIAITMAWLSMYKETIFPLVLGVFLINQMASNAPTASAS
jgi:hypothetical protein